MVFGSVFAQFDRVSFTTADDKNVEFKNSIITRVGFYLIGIPHIGLRLRAKKILSNLPKTSDKQLLDAGCGSGIYSFSLAKRFQTVLAVDIQEDLIKKANEINRYKNLDFRVMDLSNLKLKENSFDTVICSDVLEHIQDDVQVLGELSRVLKRDGTLLLTVPSISEKNKKTYKKYRHVRVGYDRDAMEELCSKTNLKLMSCEYYCSNSTEKLFGITEKFMKNYVVLGLIFYPFYMLSILFDIFSNEKNSNGLFVKITK
ncbi:MAG: class I SAM-dependent methyltransferase [Candidatus Micrarchaeota archaeon]